ncbi:MAG: hypothetical protein ACK4UN_09535 [Limisphaerales bacterium]
MMRNVLSAIGGVEIYGIISICLFFTVFTGALIWAAFQKKAFCNKMSSLPLHDGEVPVAQKGETLDEK